MTTNWTTVGEKFTKGKEQKYQGIFDRVEWIKPPCTMSAMAGLGIKACIKELNIPKVSHVADSFELAPYGLYGVRGHYTQGEVDIFILDRGIDCVVLASCPKF